MEALSPMPRRLSQPRWLSSLVIGLTLALLGGVILLGRQRLRETIGHQIVHRDAEVLDEVATLERMGAGSPAALAQQLEDTAGQMTLALRLSKLRDGVMATRLFDAHGRFVAALPALVRERDLTPDEQQVMTQLRPRSRYDRAARLWEHFLVAPDPASEKETGAPLLSVLIPIQAPGSTNLLAVAELIQDGSGIAQELAALDRHLTFQAAALFAICGGIVALVLGWGFHRLHASNLRLEHHAAELRRVNQELALSAKTSALGSVTAHLLHALSSPLTGLQQFVAAHATDDAAWQDAVRGTQRMQALVSEIVRVLGEQTDGASYDLPLPELAQIAGDRARASAEAARVQFELRSEGHGALANGDANLVLLILENLLQNAVQATPPGKTVRLIIRSLSRGLLCEVADEGPGLPARVRENLFLPSRSTKPGGNGIGLALSGQLARHLGAELTLARSSEAGSAFALTLPQALLERRQLSTASPAEAAPSRF